MSDKCGKHGHLVVHSCQCELSRLKAALALAEGALESAAKTAHYRQNNFCNGDFENCVNCGKWRKALSEIARVRKG